MDEKNDIYAEGYGRISKSVMKSRLISNGAKSVYAYLCAYCGSDNICYPSQETIRRELDISRDTLSKYLRELAECGYITVTQEKENGKFSRNVYKVEQYPP